MTSDLACETTVIASLQRYEVHGKRRVPFNSFVSCHVDPIHRWDTQLINDTPKKSCLSYKREQ